MSDLHNAISTWRPLTPALSSSSAKPGRAADAGETFQAALSAAADRQSGTWNISAHAQQRLAQRGLSLSQSDLVAMDQVANQAQSKGSKNAYMIVGQAGLVVNLPSRTVVTAMQHEPNTIVTQIDSVVVVNKPDHVRGSLPIGDRLNR
ncbi:hypothetical protein NZD89_17685 [Alicyclobacillus fastidiosus]|uniref:Flagellar operon protein n=1 Tax=Alicyclobacillus fastidiosus TaxID=392011 RepID=A0ABY6ZBD7_9BACL|nr:hypothetical protein [Alicyclobacillus fastidiosus]WAH40204.1 hypothetical protein NZD89_17685 [Alicyclobacillus fastidiosus]GMA61561.1 flagellar protein [Alicyclobacillus fastidiosus]